MASVEQQAPVETNGGSAANTIPVENPATGELITTIPVLGAAEIEAMVERARAAQPGWAEAGFDERRKVLRRAQKWMLDNVDRVIEVVVSESGKTHEDAQLADFGYTYRHSEMPEGLIWTNAVFQGRPDDPAAITARMEEITARREASQPIREKTGGSTFKNPPGHSAWKLVDEAGWRGRPFGGAMFSPQHANFLINTGEATAADLEGLGEAVRADVLGKFGVELEWEIKRIGRPSAA